MTQAVVAQQARMAYQASQVQMDDPMGLVVRLYDGMMARAIRGQSLARTLMMMPMMFAPILVGFQFKWFFNAQVGLVNNLLYALSGESHFIPWLIDTP